MHIVVEGVAARDLRERYPAFVLEQPCVGRLAARVQLLVGRHHPVDDGVGQQRDRVKHRPTARPLRRRESAVRPATGSWRAVP